VALVRHNSSFMFKDYHEEGGRSNHVMQDDSFLGTGDDNNPLIKNILKQSKIKTDGGGPSAGGKTPTLSLAGDDK